MKRFVLIPTLFLFIISSLLSAQTANHILISEFATQGANGQDEFVELYNPTEAEINLNGWTLQYKTSSGTTWGDKAVLPSSAIIPAHGYFLIANTSYVVTTIPDYTSGLWTSAAGISSIGHLRIIDHLLNEIDKVGYGASAVDPEGSPAPVQAANSQSVERRAFSTSTADSLAAGGRHYLAGNGYDSDNNANDFVQQTHGRQPQNSFSAPEPAFGVGGNGTGAVVVNPAVVFNNFLTSLTFTIKGDSGYALNVVKCIVPAGWSWSHDVSGVGLSGSGFDTALVAVSIDTIIISQAGITPTDLGTITMSNMTSPVSGGATVFRFITAVYSGDPAQILLQPRVQVNASVPIVTVHVNDAQGVPTSPYAVNSTVTVTGTVTANLSGTQTNVFIQDATAGVNLFDFTRPMNFNVGDSVILTGKIVQFRGLVEIQPTFSTVTILDTGRTLPEPLVVTCADVNATFQPDYTEPNEGRLIRINAVSYNSLTSMITDATGSTQIFIPASFPPTPSVFDAIGILKQFKPGTSPPPPYTSNYEISPRFPEDIIGHPGPVITVTPVEDSIQSTAVRINWSTDVMSSSMVFFGSTTSYIDSVIDTATTTAHSVSVSGLNPATIYHYAVASEDINGRTLIGDFLFSTASPAGTTGQMNVYFNKTVDVTVSSGENALANQDLTSRFISRINAARHSIDACFYNLSSTPGATIADALVAAKLRGVKVRLIGEDDNSGNAPFNTVASYGIPFITDAYDVQNGGTGLMHNKFAVIDYQGGAPESVWVWTGSWNPSDPGTNNDRQNSIEIQDVALAGAYTMEFNEMWGSSSQSPNPSLSRFGARKTNNTPHVFNINNVPVQCYFSPSDRTTSQIGKTLSKAKKSISVNMYTFTRGDLADSLVVQKNRGRKVRVVLDNSSDLGAQFGYLNASGVDIHVKGFSGGLLHHKYAIVDAAPLGGTPWVITGSHNWSSSAENSNNENTLIIQNERIANLYLQEFTARYKEAGGSDPIILGVKEISSAVPSRFELYQNFPNPFNPTTTIRFQTTKSEFVNLRIFNVLGQEVATLVNETKQHGTYDVEWDASALASGLYFYQITAGDFVSVKKLVLLR